MVNRELRVLVLDESRLMAWIVEHVAPPGTKVVGLTSFDDARRALLENPPDAAIVSVTSARRPWREFRLLCTERRPPVPLLYESCVFANSEDAGLGGDPGGARFLRTPASRADLEGALVRLLDDARAAREGASPVLDHA